jgi:hypothetical protein
MSNVVNLGTREPLVWCCAACGCSTFKLYQGGITECAACELKGSDNGEWINELPEPTGPVKDRLPDSKVISFGDASPAAALRSMLQRVDADSLVCIIAMENNGRVRTWGGIDAQDRVEWLDRRLVEARGLLTMLTPKGRN